MENSCGCNPELQTTLTTALRSLSTRYHEQTRKHKRQKANNSTLNNARQRNNERHKCIEEKSNITKQESKVEIFITPVRFSGQRSFQILSKQTAIEHSAH